MILFRIAEKTKERVKAAKENIPFHEIRKRAEHMAQAEKEEMGELPYAFEKALREKGMSFICEVKKASPSKGVLADHFQPVEIAKEYEKAGASAVSVITEPFFFQGDNRYLSDIKKAITIPVLRKDFVVDSYMIYEAKIMGADAVLLICSLLSFFVLKEYIQMAHSLGLSTLVEAHTDDEVLMAQGAGARIIGVNNRNLKTFEVDMQNSRRLRKLVHPGILFVSESGIKTWDDIKFLMENGTDGVLIGETMMGSSDKSTTLAKLRGEIQ